MTRILDFQESTDVQDGKWQVMAHQVSHESPRESISWWTGRSCVDASGLFGRNHFWLQLLAMSLVILSLSKPFLAAILRVLVSFRSEIRRRPNLCGPPPATQLSACGIGHVVGCRSKILVADFTPFDTHSDLNIATCLHVDKHCPSHGGKVQTPEAHELVCKNQGHMRFQFWNRCEQPCCVL